MATRQRNDLISALSKMVESQFRHLLHLFIGYAAQSAAATARPPLHVPQRPAPKP
jgi:hypothetical protein